MNPRNRATAALLLAASLFAHAGCGSGTPPAHVGKVTPQGRLFEADDFSITVPLRFMATGASASATRYEAEQAGLRKAQADAVVAMSEFAIESGLLRFNLFDGTSTDVARADQIIVCSLPSGLFSRTDRAIADQRLQMWLDMEPVKWERIVVNGREVDRLHARAPKYGTESFNYYLDAGATTYVVQFETKPERVEKILVESEEIMRRFTVR
jgi:hypothetical protein